ncbi:MAG: response regulator [Sporomusaceae bacterium]|nr:response regulator [Sporomusaceae bacterium]
MMRIAAVDDEMHALKRFERMVQKNDGIDLCGLFETGEQLIGYLKEHTLDAVFLDIEMPGVNGLALSQQIIDLNENIEIVFVTAFNQYAVEAFELQAIDYIMKPLKKVRLEKTVKRLLGIKGAVTKPSELFIQCFGDFEVFLNGEAMVWKNSKAKEILAFLIHKNGIAVDWQKIADAVWPEHDFEKSQANFHANNYLLRKKLTKEGIAGIIEGSRGNYRVLKDRVSCDLYQLEAMIKDKRINRKEDIRLLEELVQNGYMEGNGYSWAQPRAAELDGMCRKLLVSWKKNK